MIRYLGMGLGAVFMAIGGILMIDFIVDKISFNKKNSSFDAICMIVASVICSIGAFIWKVAG